MLEVHTCSKCKNKIKIKAMRGFTHICCEQCGQCFQLCQKSLKYYMFLPFIAVAISVSLSINFIITNDIFVKAVFILSVSYLLYLIMGMGLIKMNILQYEKKEQEDQNGRKNEKI